MTSVNTMVNESSISGRRSKWCELLLSLSFEEGASEILKRLRGEVKQDKNALKEHLLLAGIIPEKFGHDSTAEKLFAKYSDTVVALAFEELGCKADVVTERGDRADVDIRFDDTHLVADAKAFRLSRTAKNQKDFKVEALDSWRNGADAAVLVAPLFQYPVNTSQIYEQATRRNVLLLSFTHLQSLLMLPKSDRLTAVSGLLKAPASREAEKSAASYWTAVRTAMVGAAVRSSDAWTQAVEQERLGIEVAVNIEASDLKHAFDSYSAMSRDELLAEVAKAHGVHDRLKRVHATTVTKVFDY